MDHLFLSVSANVAASHESLLVSVAAYAPAPIANSKMLTIIDKKRINWNESTVAMHP